MRVSVVLCTYDPALFSHFRAAADSVFANSHPAELVVVVDGNPALGDQVHETYGTHDDVTIYENDENVGLLESRNTGAEIASDDVVAFLDDDARADPEWIARLVAAYEDHDSLAVSSRLTPE